MSLYYSTKIVKLLAAERLREAQQARLAAEVRHDPRTVARESRFAGLLGRVVAQRPTAEDRRSANVAACTC
jgi:hypothetical protein